MFAGKHRKSLFLAKSPILICFIGVPGCQKKFEK
jgi:hypothetical protein